MRKKQKLTNLADSYLQFFQGREILEDTLRQFGEGVCVHVTGRRRKATAAAQKSLPCMAFDEAWSAYQEAQAEFECIVQLTDSTVPPGDDDSH